MVVGRFRQSGLTLVELLVTLAIAGILVTVAIPGFGELLERQRQVATNNAVSSALKEGQAAAASRQMPVTVDLAHNSGDWSVRLLAPDNTVFAATPLPSIGASGPSTAWSVTFSPLGRRQQCSETDCLLPVTRGPDFWVEVDWTGRIVADTSRRPDDA